MGKKRAYGYTFITYKGDHPPLHVHIWRNQREIGRWNVEDQITMDDLEVGRNLRKALAKLGYLLETGNEKKD